PAAARGPGDGEPSVRHHGRGGGCARQLGVRAKAGAGRWAGRARRATAACETVAGAARAWWGGTAGGRGSAGLRGPRRGGATSYLGGRDPDSGPGGHRARGSHRPARRMIERLPATPDGLASAAELLDRGGL